MSSFGVRMALFGIGGLAAAQGEANDELFKSRFDCAGVPGCGPNVYVSLQASIPAGFPGGLAIDWVAGTATLGSPPYGTHLVVSSYSEPPPHLLRFYWTAAGDHLSEGVGLNGIYSVLQSGAIVGAGSHYTSNPSAGAAAAWHALAGRHGYLGFRFRNWMTGEINYGYARIAANAMQATLIYYVFDYAGNPVTIP